ncbi:MAG: fibronectin type III domain-containing protein [Opitutaceae bacterium]|nr:fibronectin type III domain-containing protein [Opitutaceae bacterium]
MIPGWKPIEWSSVCRAVLAAICACAASNCGKSNPGRASPVLRGSSAADCASFGIAELESVVAAREMPPERQFVIESLDHGLSDETAARFSDMVPKAPESFIIRSVGATTWILGSDAVGTMYGALSAAESLRSSPDSLSLEDRTESPFLELRAVNQFLHEDALQDPDSWFFQEDFWQGYFSMLARTRHNLLDLHGGYNLSETTFPNLFRYFVSLPEFPKQSVGGEEAKRNLSMLRRIIAIGEAHGVKVALMNYTVQGRKAEARNDGLEGFDTAALERYTYQAARSLLEQCPELWMYGFRIGESGQPEDFFEKTYLPAARDSGYRGRLYTRSWLATKERIEKIKRSVPGDFYVEVKYNGEQLGTAYQAITSPTNFDPSYSYQGYTSEPRDFKLIYQVRANGTLRIFHWGDPEFVARVARSCQALGSSSGYSVEPMTAYYPMTDRYHGAQGHHYFRWAWQRDWFWYEVWGRLGYDPSLPSGHFKNLFVRRFGEARHDLYRLLTVGSKVVPLIASAVALGPDHRQWAPELETGTPDFTNADGRLSHGNLEDGIDVAPLDSMVMTSLAEAARMETSGVQDGRTTPRRTADELFAIAEELEGMLERPMPPAENKEEADCIRLDAQALAALARFAAERYLAGIALAEYRISRYPRALASARVHLEWARSHWRDLARTADRHYGPILDTLRMHSEAFRWESQIAVIDSDLGWISSLEKKLMDEPRGAQESRLSHLAGAGTEMRNAVAGDLLRPVQWRYSGFVGCEKGGRTAYESVGGQIGFDAEDLFLCNVDDDMSLEVDFWDPGAGEAGAVEVLFDQAEKRPGIPGKAGELRLGIERGWRSAKFVLEGARLAGTGPGNTDVVFRSMNGEEFTIRNPRLSVAEPFAHRLTVHVKDALKHPPRKVALWWKEPGTAWRETAMEAGLGEPGPEGGSVPLAREYYSCALPSGIPEVEYYFVAEFDRIEERLPVAPETFRWKLQDENNAPVIAPIAVEIKPVTRDSCTVSARVDSAGGVARVVLHYKPIPSQENWRQVDMQPSKSNTYTATVPITSEGLLYQFQAWDREGNARIHPDYRRETPYLVIPSWNPSATQEHSDKGTSAP